VRQKGRCEKGKKERHAVAQENYLDLECRA
jgi:hypothetical protein